jgi:hypothetical protein
MLALTIVCFSIYSQGFNVLNRISDMRCTVFYIGISVNCVELVSWGQFLSYLLPVAPVLLGVHCILIFHFDVFQVCPVSSTSYQHCSHFKYHCILCRKVGNKSLSLFHLSLSPLISNFVITPEWYLSKFVVHLTNSFLSFFFQYGKSECRVSDLLFIHSVHCGAVWHFVLLSSEQRDRSAHLHRRMSAHPSLL